MLPGQVTRIASPSLPMVLLRLPIRASRRSNVGTGSDHDLVRFTATYDDSDGARPGLMTGMLDSFLAQEDETGWDPNAAKC